MECGKGRYLAWIPFLAKSHVQVKASGSASVASDMKNKMRRNVSSADRSAYRLNGD